MHMGGEREYCFDERTKKKINSKRAMWKINEKSIITLYNTFYEELTVLHTMNKPIL